MNRPILILGSAGYIGSALSSKLITMNFSINCVDITTTSGHTHISKDYDSLTLQELEGYESIILLAGNSSVRSCQGPLAPVFDNNVSKFVRLLDKLVQLDNPPKSVIYASSASVYGRGHMINDGSNEDLKLPFPINQYDLTKQTIDSIARLYMHKLKIYGLRFGTVCGFSPNMRWDTIINAMFRSYKTTNQIIYNSATDRRAVLSIRDLINTVCNLIIKSHNIPSGIYNVYSFNSTIGNIAQEVYWKLEKLKPENIYPRPLLLENKTEDTSVYDFTLNRSKLNKFSIFDDSYKTDSIHDIILDLNEHVAFT